MSAIGRALVLAALARRKVLDARAGNVRALQERTLNRLLRRAAATDFGQRHGFRGLAGGPAFARAVPLHRYRDLKPWFERALAGERDVTWPGQTRYFGMSSGTTAGNKYLPISDDSVRQQQRGGFDPIASYLAWSRDTSLLDEKAVMLGGSSRLQQWPGGALVGDNTGIMARHMPWLARRCYLPSRRVRAIEGWEEKLEALVAESLDADVRLLAGTPSWFPGLFDRLLLAARQRGRRAEHVHDVWPNLRMMTGGGVNFEPYRRLIRARLGRHVPYVDVYNATEGGIMGVQDRADDPAMRLLPDSGVYYEFVPLEEIERPTPTRLGLADVEPGVVYALAVSTMSGIFSYLIGDCLRFVETFPHRFVFEGRTAAFLNVTGEHVSQGELERALRRAAEQLTVHVRDFTVTANVGVGRDAGCQHTWLVEFEGRPPDLDRCAALIDHDLAAGNGDYAAHRSSQSGLLPPRVRPLEAGAFDAWMKQRGKLGGQNKVPRVLHDPAARRALLSLAVMSRRVAG